MPAFPGKSYLGIMASGRFGREAEDEEMEEVEEDIEVDEEDLGEEEDTEFEITQGAVLLRR